MHWTLSPSGNRLWKMTPACVDDSDVPSAHYRTGVFPVCHNCKGTVVAVRGPQSAQQLVLTSNRTCRIEAQCSKRPGALTAPHPVTSGLESVFGKLFI